MVSGTPDYRSISTSYVERQKSHDANALPSFNALRELISEKAGEFQAAVALDFAYNNFVRVHKSLRMTPAIAAANA